jgi:hypothetical protein
MAIQRLLNSPGGAKYLTQGLAPEARAALPEWMKRGLLTAQPAAQMGLGSYLLAPAAQ